MFSIIWKKLNLMLKNMIKIVKKKHFKPTSLCSYSLMMCTYLRSNKYQFYSIWFVPTDAAELLWRKDLNTICIIRVITKLPNSEQSYKGKVKTHKYINRQKLATYQIWTCTTECIFMLRHFHEYSWQINIIIFTI
jgi:hypothetical protein